MAREMGPTAEAVAENLKRLLAARRLSARSFAASMPDGPGQLTHSAVSEVARGARRVDVDELTALAAALGVSPVTLLLPPATSDPTVIPGDPYEPENLWPPGRVDPDVLGGEQYTVRLTGTGPMHGDTALAWLRGDAPPAEPDAAPDAHTEEAFRRRSLPWWAWEWHRGGGGKH